MPVTAAHRAINILAAAPVTKNQRRKETVEERMISGCAFQVMIWTQLVSHEFSSTLDIFKEMVTVQHHTLASYLPEDEWRLI